MCGCQVKGDGGDLLLEVQKGFRNCVTNDSIRERMICYIIGKAVKCSS